jgi:hypothetical protein
MTEETMGLLCRAGLVDVVNLPEVGIKGNSHMLMDKNNSQVADPINKSLAEKGLVD